MSPACPTASSTGCSPPCKRRAGRSSCTTRTSAPSSGHGSGSRRSGSTWCPTGSRPTATSTIGGPAPRYPPSCASARSGATRGARICWRRSSGSGPTPGSASASRVAATPTSRPRWPTPPPACPSSTRSSSGSRRRARSSCSGTPTSRCCLTPRSAHRAVSSTTRSAAICPRWSPTSARSRHRSPAPARGGRCPPARSKPSPTRSPARSPIPTRGSGPPTVRAPSRSTSRRNESGPRCARSTRPLAAATRPSDRPAATSGTRAPTPYAVPITARIAFHIGYHKTATTWFQRAAMPAHPGIRPLFTDQPTTDPLLVELVLTPRHSFDADRARAALAARLAELDVPDGGIALGSQERLSGHAATGGFDTFDIAERIRATAPEAKIFAVVREQVGMVESEYLQLLQEGSLRGLDRLLRTTPTLSSMPVFDLRQYEYDRLADHYVEL